MGNWSYKPLWHILTERDMTREELRTALGISSATIAKMGRGENISMDVLHKICTYLECSLPDVVEHIHADR